MSNDRDRPPIPELPPRHERDPFTPALLQEASIPPTWHAMLLSLRRFSTATPIPLPPSMPQPSPVSARSRRHTLARARNRIGAPSDRPISAETYIEHRIILAVIADRRRIGGIWAGWAAEAQDIIDQVVPTRRDLLETYAHMRHLIRRRRTTWKLQEHHPELGDIADSLP